MELAVNAWSWIMASKPSLDRRMLALMIRTWQAVANDKDGLYASYETSLNPFTQPMTYGEPERRTANNFNCDAHTIWIHFLNDRFKSDRLFDIEHVKLYGHLFEVSCQPSFKMRQDLI